MRNLTIACIPLALASVLTFVTDLRFHGQGTRFRHTQAQVATLAGHTSRCVRYAAVRAVLPLCLAVGALTALSIAFGR